MIIKTEESHSLGLILFNCIILSLIPILITTLMLPNFINSGAYSLTVGIVFLVQVIIMFSCYTRYTMKLFNLALLLLALAFMISQSITIFQLTLKGLEWDKFDLINMFVRFTTVLIFVCIPAKFSMSRKELEKFMFYLVMLGLIASLYNMVINFGGMMDILNISNPYAVNFKSFFTGRNIFAQLLFFCLIANTILCFTNRSIFSWISYFVLGLNIFATLSRTVTASVGVFIIVFFLMHYKKKHITKIIILIFTSILALIVIRNQELINFIVTMLIRTETGTTGRSVVWNAGFQILNQTSWIFGTGYLTSRNILRSMGRISQFHSFYIEVLVGGGIIDILLHLAIFGFVIKKIRTIYSNDKLVGIVYISGYMGLIFYSLFESASFFSMGYVDSIFRIFFITVPILYANSFSIQRKTNND